MNSMNKKIVPEIRKSIDDFTVLQKVGEGSFSSVFKVIRNSDGKIYALKKVKLSILNLKEKNNALNQVRILASIRSSFILEYRDAFFDEERKFLCIVMEWANRGDLQQQIKRQSSLEGVPFGEKEIWRAAIHILQGLNLLHEKGILHCDLKAANIFISNDQYKIGDMNVSKVEGEHDLALAQTTPYYSSPQIWRDQPYGFKADIWSFGCIIYEMCTLRPPFQAEDMEDLYKKITRGKFKPIPSIYSPELSSLIDCCLCKKLEQRPTAKKILTMKSYNIDLCPGSNQFALLKLMNIQDNIVHLPKSNYDEDQARKRKINEQNTAMSERQYLPSLSSREKEGRIPLKKKFSLKYRQILQGVKIITMPSENNERVSSQRSLRYLHTRGNSQSHILISKLSAINLSSNALSFRNISTERKQNRESHPGKHQLNIIQQLRRKCEAHKDKLKKVNSSGDKRVQKIINKEYMLCESERTERSSETRKDYLRKASKRPLEKYPSNQRVSKQDETINKSEIGMNLQLEVQKHRKINLKKKGKSYKAKIFI